MPWLSWQDFIEHFPTGTVLAGLLGIVQLIRLIATWRRPLEHTMRRRFFNARLLKVVTGVTFGLSALATLFLVVLLLAVNTSRSTEIVTYSLLGLAIFWLVIGLCQFFNELRNAQAAGCYLFAAAYGAILCDNHARIDHSFEWEAGANVCWGMIAAFLLVAVGMRMSHRREPRQFVYSPSPVTPAVISPIPPAPQTSGWSYPGLAPHPDHVGTSNDGTS